MWPAKPQACLLAYNDESPLRIRSSRVCQSCIHRGDVNTQDNTLLLVADLKENEELAIPIKSAVYIANL
jgi:hypothetical protein